MTTSAPMAHLSELLALTAVLTTTSQHAIDTTLAEDQPARTRLIIDRNTLTGHTVISGHVNGALVALDQVTHGPNQPHLHIDTIDSAAQAHLDGQDGQATAPPQTYTWTVTVKGEREIVSISRSEPTDEDEAAIREAGVGVLIVQAHTLPQAHACATLELDAQHAADETLNERLVAATAARAAAHGSEV
ncbi:hypothetical protein OG455_27845 [Kitasatospora sp. NBC_01287]|uniref:hypothetical protein n=1 Tax=Kitasatospora sp. NBC_01287 TaxID=2903573 RepID=UPI00225402C5|nr:hypothetical protein [Kitasatospora sp. NBC_01287]MCX4749275.1 hypothetical protein [Kitasatospora sp. NBC_01287]